METLDEAKGRLSPLIRNRRDHVPEARKKVLTLQEKVALHHARMANYKSTKPTSSSSCVKAKEKIVEKPLKPIITVRAEQSCRQKQHKTSVSPPKKPISLKDYNERKLMDELFGETDLEKEKLPKKSVTFEKSVVKAAVESEDDTSPPHASGLQKLSLPHFSGKMKTNKNKAVLSGRSNRITTSPPYDSFSKNTKSHTTSLITKPMSSLPTTVVDNPFGKLLPKPNKPSTTFTTNSATFSSHSSPFTTFTNTSLFTDKRKGQDSWSGFPGRQQEQQQLKSRPIGVVSPQQRSAGDSTMVSLGKTDVSKKKDAGSSISSSGKTTDMLTKTKKDVDKIPTPVLPSTEVIK